MKRFQPILALLIFAAILLQTAQAQQALDPDLFKAWDRFRAKHGNQLTMSLHPQTQTPYSIRGVFRPVEALQALKAQSITEASAPAVVSALIAQHRDLFRITPAQLRLKRVHTTGLNGFPVVHILAYEQVAGNIPVHGSHVYCAISEDGTILSMGAKVHPEIDVPLAPTIGRQQAIRLANTHLQLGRTDGEADLIIYPVWVGDRFNYHLAWQAKTGEFGEYHTFVDAESGVVIKSFDTSDEATYTLQGKVTFHYWDGCPVNRALWLGSTDS